MGEMSDYIAGLEGPERDLIERIRARAVSLVPDAVEGMSYGMPALRYRESPLLSVVSAKGHIGLYPFSPAVVSAVETELDGYSWSKGTIRFTAEHPLPDSVVDRIVLLRRDEIDAAKKR
ncbi:iron chaperone [Agromyces bauzanensis]